MIINKITNIFTKTLLLAQDWAYSARYSTKYHLPRVREGRRLQVVVPFQGVFNGDTESAKTLGLITDLLTSNNIDFFVFTDSNHKFSIIVMSEEREKAINLVNGSKDSFLGYYYVKEGYTKNIDAPRLVSRLIDTNSSSNTGAIHIYRHIGTDNKKVIDGWSYAVSLEFWSHAEDLTKAQLSRAMDEAGILDEKATRGALIAPIQNGIAKVFVEEEQVFVDYQVGELKTKTLEIFTRNQLGCVNFPIDVVYTWVDGNDIDWQERYLAARSDDDPNYINNTMARYTDHEELRYSLRSIEMYAPWVRNIFIVTDRQRPKWLKNELGSKVKIIDHKDIFTDTSALPVFNSHAIESQIHHIKDLSEHYLYLNDDMMFASPTKPETFFYPNGVARVLPSAAPIGTGKPSHYESAPSSAGKNARDIVLQKFNVFTTNKYRHAPYPQIKSLAYQIEDENQTIIDKTMHSKFRSHEDIPFTSVLTQSYLLASGRGIQSPYRSVTINVSEAKSDQVIQALNGGSTNLVSVCLNESVTDDSDAIKVAERINEYLLTNYPFLSRWENDK